MIESNGKNKVCEKCQITFSWQYSFCPGCGSELAAARFKCNCCGESCLLEGEENGGLLDHTVSGGYHSTPGNGDGALDDTTGYTFSLCEFCLDWLFTNFVIPPKISHYMGGKEDEEWRSAEQRVLEDDWRRMKQHFIETKTFRDQKRNKKR